MATRSSRCPAPQRTGHYAWFRSKLMDETLREIAQHHAHGSLGLEPDPNRPFAGVRAPRKLADFCEGHQVRRLREVGQTWAAIAAWAGVSPLAVYKKYAQAFKVTEAQSTYPSFARRYRPAPPALAPSCGTRCQELASDD